MRFDHLRFNPKSCIALPLPNQLFRMSSLVSQHKKVRYPKYPKKAYGMMIQLFLHCGASYFQRKKIRVLSDAPWDPLVDSMGDGGRLGQCVQWESHRSGRMEPTWLQKPWEKHMTKNVSRCGMARHPFFLSF